MIQAMISFSRQGKLRLQRWFVAHQEKQRKSMIRELISIVVSRKGKNCNFLEYKGLKIVYRLYASLYFLLVIEEDDNQLLSLEIVHRYVEVLDLYFGSVCELDIIFNFEKAYFILDELILAGEIQETGRRQIVDIIHSEELLQEEDAPLSLLEEFGAASL